MVKIIATTILLSSMVLLFQNCGEVGFSANVLEQSSVGGFDLSYNQPNVNRVEAPEINGVFKADLIVVQGTSIDVPVGNDFNPIVKIESRLSSNLKKIKGRLLVQNSQFSNRGQMTVTLSNGDQHQLYLDVLPQLKVQVNGNQPNLTEGESHSMIATIEAPADSNSLKNSEHNFKNASVLDVKWFKKNGARLDEIQSNLVQKYTIKAVDENNKIVLKNVYRLIKVDREDAGEYIVNVSSQVGNVEQKISKKFVVTVGEKESEQIDTSTSGEGSNPPAAPETTPIANNECSGEDRYSSTVVETEGIEYRMLKVSCAYSVQILGCNRAVPGSAFHNSGGTWSCYRRNGSIRVPRWVYNERVKRAGSDRRFIFVLDNNTSQTIRTAGAGEALYQECKHAVDNNSYSTRYYDSQLEGCLSQVGDQVLSVIRSTESSSYSKLMGLE